MFNTYFRKSCLLWDIVEKYYRTEQATESCALHTGCPRLHSLILCYI